MWVAGLIVFGLICVSLFLLLFWRYEQCLVHEIAEENKVREVLAAEYIKRGEVPPPDCFLKTQMYP